MTETETASAPVRAGTPNLNKALSQLQGELPRITKTKTGKIEGENKAGKYFSYEYSYADLGDVVADHLYSVFRQKRLPYHHKDSNNGKCGGCKRYPAPSVFGRQKHYRDKRLARA